MIEGGNVFTERLRVGSALGEHIGIGIESILQKLKWLP
jgi:hypothetical protein